MSRLFYARMAAVNLRKNYRTFVPYLFTCTVSVMMFYILCALSFGDMIGGQFGFAADTIKSFLFLGIFVVGLFSVIFLFYTNSFLTKRRKREFGLYNILGMEKRHIGCVMVYETIYTALMALGAGLVGGILLSKLMALCFLKLLRVEGGASFEVPPLAIGYTLILFLGIFLLTCISGLLAVRLSSPVELLRGGQVGEKEPKARWLLAVVGGALLAGGYYLAVTITDPVQAMVFFFVAVILVILGTYGLFTAGSVAILKLLKQNKRYYYQTSHFISVSGMIYRMKQNAVGLANICILSTMVLVMLSSTVSLYAGVQQGTQQELPRDILVSTRNADARSLGTLHAQCDERLLDAGLAPQNAARFRYLAVTSIRDGEAFSAAAQEYTGGEITLAFIPQKDVERLLGGRALAPDEVLLKEGADYDGDTLTAYGRTFRVAGTVPLDFIGTAYTFGHALQRIVMVVHDESVLEQINRAQREARGDGASTVHAIYTFDVDADDARMMELAQSIAQDVGKFGVQSRAELRQGMYQLYGGLFFLGLFLGALFIMATVIIMYYKQMSEGYDDRRRYQIMRGVGLGRLEIRRAIRSQVLTVFFLPLVVAGVHIAFAFPMIVRLLSMLGMHNVRMFAVSTAFAFALFGLLYAVVYALTARTYYRIVAD